ncbi:hypothetical protein MYAM1_001367 [Malassezia yamatoensis]|uniref:Uncharacterized protein n=1 Tax=Malassezia yamatoensis TaxID=253288 RepID=A0AAJ6CIA7_9BASI|nr:hypothetical protein MYAM1_001367 [Malassezia yamatoensis]
MDEPAPTPMLGMPFDYAEQLKESPRITKLRHGLEGILLSVRRLREGIMSNGRMDDLTIDVYETSVILSILCGDKPQLASSISRLINDVYPNVSGDSLRNAQTGFLSRDIYALFASEICPSALWKEDSGESNSVTDRIALFKGVWLLESICSNRPGYAQEYLARKASLRKHEQSPSGELSMNFCHKVFLAIQRKEPMSLHDIMTVQLTKLTSCSSTMHGGSTILFWLRTMAQRVLPMARAHSCRIIRHAFLRMSVWRELQDILRDEVQAEQITNMVPANNESVRYFESKLLLNEKLQHWTHTQPLSSSPPTVHDMRKHNSLITLMALARQFGKQSWSDAQMFLRNRLVEHQGSFAITLKP